VSKSIGTVQSVGTVRSVEAVRSVGTQTGKGVLPVIEKIGGLYDVEAAAKAKAKKGYGTIGVQNIRDEAEFSAFAVELARVSAELKSVPEVRQERIDEFKKQVEAGAYSPPLEKVAHNLFLAGILDIGE
jgi:flagellar biosynthesis anti-sigma factor FlgM